MVRGRYFTIIPAHSEASHPAPMIIRIFITFLLAIPIVFSIVILLAMALMLNMPGRSFSGSPPALSKDELVLRENLRRHLTVLASDIGERNNLKYDNLCRAASYIEEQFKLNGYEPRLQSFDVQDKKYTNIEATIKGASKQIILVGAHYDTVAGCPGADDNGTGIVSILELARLLKETKPQYTIRFVAFPNEEYPFFWSKAMGSYVYAGECRSRGDDIQGMIAVETVGYYSQREHSQKYPVNTLGFLPDRGDFLFFVGNYRSRGFLTDCLGSFRKYATIPSEGISAFDCFDDISRSDNNSFWIHGYPGLMITDTADFRNPNYHLPSDRVETIDFDNLTRFVSALSRSLQEMSTKSSL